MAKPRYSLKLVEQVAGLIEKDSYTIAEICRIVGISERSYYNWVAANAEFADAIKKAKDKFDEHCVVEAKKSLMKKIMGYSAEEVKTVFVEGKSPDGTIKPKIKEQTKITKHYQPDTASIIFMLTNKAPEEFKNRQHVDAKANINHTIGFGDFLMDVNTEDDEEGGTDAD